MKNRILTWLIVLIVFIVSIKAVMYTYDKKLAKADEIIRVDIIKHDSLVKLKDGLYTKLIADTLTNKELKKVIDSLELKVKNPEIVIQEVIVIKEIEKEVDGIVVKDSTLTIDDNYPNKDNPFVTYNAVFNLKDSTGVSKFTFSPIKLSLGIGLNKNGTYYVNTKVPDFIEVKDVVVQALPMIPSKKDNFGVLVGGGLGFDLTDGTQFLELNAGIRIHKFYLGVAGTTNNTVTAGAKIEF